MPAALCAALAALTPFGAEGQSSRFELDVSASRITYDTLAPLDAPSASLLAEWQRPSLFGRLTGGATSFRGSGWSVQGGGSLAGWLAPRGRLDALRLELGGALAGSHHSGGFDSGTARVDGRVHLLRASRGLWAGASLVSARTSYDPSWSEAFVPGVGVWAQNNTVRAMVSYEHTTFSAGSYPEANLALTLTRGDLDLSVFAGAREWPGDPGFGDELWARAAATYWITPHAAVTVSGGKYAWDVLRDLPGSDVISLGVRLTPRRARPIPTAAVAPIVYTTSDVRAGTLSFEVDGARRVEIAGDWTGWQPVPLAQDVAGRWVLPEALAPGAYRFNLRVDGERWLVPPGFPTLDDGFGGTVGLLIVSETGAGM